MSESEDDPIPSPGGSTSSSECEIPMPSIPPTIRDIIVRVKNYIDRSPITEINIGANETVFAVGQLIDAFLLSQEVCSLRYFANLYIRDASSCDTPSYTRVTDEDATLTSVGITDETEIYIEGPMVEEGVDDSKLKAEAVQRLLQKIKNTKQEYAEFRETAEMELDTTQNKLKAQTEMTRNVQLSATANLILSHSNADAPLTAFWKALSGHHPPEVFLLMAKHPRCGIERKSSNNENIAQLELKVVGATPFLLAVLAKRLDVAKVLQMADANVLAVCTDPPPPITTDRMGRPQLQAPHVSIRFDALKIAVLNNDAPMVSFLVSISDKYPLNKEFAMWELALNKNHTAAALALLKGAEDSLFKAGWFSYVARNDYRDLVKAFLDHNSSILKTTYDDGKTVLHLVATEGHLDLVKMFLSYDSSIIDFEDDTGQSALHCAASEGQTKIIRYLMEQGCDYQIKDEDDKTAADVAEENYKSYEVTEWHAIQCLLTGVAY